MNRSEGKLPQTPCCPGEVGAVELRPPKRASWKACILPAVAAFAVQAAACVGLFFAVFCQAFGYLFPWVVLAVIHLSFPLHLPEMTGLVLGIAQVVFVSVLVGMAFSGSQLCRRLLIAWLVLHAVGVVICQPWNMSRTF